MNPRIAKSNPLTWSSVPLTAVRSGKHGHSQIVVRPGGRATSQARSSAALRKSVTPHIRGGELVGGRMAVPDYQSLMAPTLSVLADGTEHSLAELRTVVAGRLALTKDDLREKIPSGTPLIANRMHWAVTYMYQVGLLSRPKRGMVR